MDADGESARAGSGSTQIHRVMARRGSAKTDPGTGRGPLPMTDNASRNPNIAQAGGFDMPTGPGQGNGTGGAKGAKGVVAST